MFYTWFSAWIGIYEKEEKEEQEGRLESDPVTDLAVYERVEAVLETPIRTSLKIIQLLVVKPAAVYQSFLPWTGWIEFLIICLSGTSIYENEEKKLH